MRGGEGGKSGKRGRGRERSTWMVFISSIDVGQSMQGFPIINPFSDALNTEL